MELFAAATRERNEVPAARSGDETPSESLGRESDGDASPNNNEGTLKSWARAGTRSHTRYGSVSGAPGTNGNNRNLRAFPRAKELVEALLAAAQTENEDEVRLLTLVLVYTSPGLCLLCFPDRCDFHVGCLVRI